MKRLFCLLGLASSVAVGSTQEPTGDNLYERSRSAIMAGQYVEASAILEAEAFTKDSSPSTVARQLWTQFTPFMTNELDPAVFGAETPPADPVMLAALTRARPVDAIEEIARRAKTAKIVILNEAHYSPRDRAFALEVARALRPLGFSTLAAETLQNYPAPGFAKSGGEQFDADGVVRRTTGFYTADPVFAGFLRGARALGYRTVAYEQRRDQSTPDGDVPEREEAQARNIWAFLRKEPRAKLFIYVGHGHVSEASDGGDSAMMAERLKRLSGIDPLTIDQVQLAGLRPSLRAVQRAASVRLGGHPGIFSVAGKPLILGMHHPDAVDLQVVHPLRTYRYGRPSWLAKMGGVPGKIPEDLRPTTGKRLVQAFDASEPADAVPLDQVLVEAGKSSPMLMLPKDRKIRFAIQDYKLN